ncbi:MAG: Phosphoheptose isomerase [Elusimicrobia bacterium]|nr:Phosphoheptose isomerase [Elusimicrobiota bacterium]
MATANHKESILGTIAEASAVLSKMSQQVDLLDSLASVLIKAYSQGHKMVLFGNGGSAADAQHLAAEMVGSYANRSRPALPALALTTDTSALTAIGNDYSYDDVFSRQVEALVDVGDVVIGISTSGNSKNVIKAIQAARKQGAVTVGFTGETGGQLKAECDYCFCAPSKITSHIQQCHITAGHILCGLVEEAMVLNPLKV